ncbi:hypothetical protein MKX01_016431 [Papaver californicum]|nr:hypothetical protein MKX01_016431 [Papaver californicum]
MAVTLVLCRTLVGHDDVVTTVACPIENLDMIVSSFRDKSILFALFGFWDGQLRLPDLNTAVTTCGFVFHTKDIVSASRDRSIKLWNTLDERKYTIQDGNSCTNWVSCVRFSHNTSQPTIVSASWDKSVKIWNLTSCKLRITLDGHGGYVNTVFVSSDGSLCANTEDKKLYSLDAGGIIHALYFSPNRYWLCATTEEDVKIWDLESKSVTSYCSSLIWILDGSTLFIEHL